MVYQLGDIVFKPISMPSGFALEKSVNLVEKPRILGKPTLQDVGGVLDVINWEINLHWTFCDVREAVNKFQALMVTKEPKELIAGTGRSEGEFVVTQANVTYDKTDAKGKLLQAKMSIQLKEYVTAEVEDKEAIAARRAAVATISAKPITVTQVPKFQNPQSICMRDIVVTNAATGSAVSAAKKAQSIPDLAKKHVNEMNQALQTGKNSIASARSKVDALSNKVSNTVALKESMDSVISNINSLIVAGNVPEPNLTTIKNLANTLETSTQTLMSSSSILATVITLRK